ncbi:hypothetical protein I6F07_25235 [Ensifer sp. IC4062]|nr:hypothetical protein [Ensifer sp. IC4062]MCA1443466.1 hypothetical protein [Ensifer sp. IC4062]
MAKPSATLVEVEWSTVRERLSFRHTQEGPHANHRREAAHGDEVQLPWADQKDDLPDTGHKERNEQEDRHGDRHDL